jgi:hypothetical protein
MKTLSSVVELHAFEQAILALATEGNAPKSPCSLPRLTTRLFVPEATQERLRTSLCRWVTAVFPEDPVYTQHERCSTLHRIS